MRCFVTHITLLFLLCAVAFGQVPYAEWTEGATDSTGHALHTLVLHNVTQDSRVWFQELFDGKTSIEGPAMHHYQGTSWYIDIPKSGKVTLKYFGRPLPRHGWAPEGFVLQQKGKPDQPMTVKYHFLKQEDTAKTSNRYRSSGSEISFGDIIPRVKRMHYGTEPMEGTDKHPAGWYRITIWDHNNVWVETEDEDGEFYAQMTLGKLQQPLVPFTIEDWPDLPYRGFMLDVARDFRTVDEVLAILDLMAEWKLNTLHFHSADDESWCAHHALPDWNLQETAALKPTCNGRIGYSTYYTAEEYIRILRYAWERRIRVVPEFDTPGHSRASIKAMQAYERRTGDDTYRLQDPADTSHYWSAQDFTDNVLSVYLPSVYTFYGKVFDEVIRLHREAGVPLPAIHIGGDEVPAGAWSGHDRKALKEQFINGMLDLAEKRGIKLAGWEDIARNLTPETQDRLRKSLYFLNVWNTKGIEGFPVVVSPADHTYLDLAYNDSPFEIGLHWAGYVDERRTFSLQPKEYLGDIVGVEAALWSSQLRSFSDATYQMLPKGLGTAERAWNAYPGWPSEEVSDTDFERFYDIIIAKEWPVWKKKGYKCAIGDDQ